jgi:hypothetical protein
MRKLSSNIDKVEEGVKLKKNYYIIPNNNNHKKTKDNEKRRDKLDINLQLNMG